MLSGLTLSVILAIVIAATMIIVATTILFSHDRMEEELIQRLDFSFSRDSLRQAIDYYRFMAVWMLFFYVFFTSSCVLLQGEGHAIFAHSGTPAKASPIAIALFTLDLVLRGGFFDFMQHFDLTLAPVQMNRSMRWFVWYAFVFRMFYGLVMVKILFSFVWIYGKIRLNRQARRQAAVAEQRQLRLSE